MQGKSSASLAVSDIMTEKAQLLTVSPQTSVLQVMELMIDKNIRHVPVVSAHTQHDLISQHSLELVMAGGDALTITSAPRSRMMSTLE